MDLQLYEVFVKGVNFTQDELNEILKGYIEAALWTEEERLKEAYAETVYQEEIDDDPEDKIEKIINAKKDLKRKEKKFQYFLKDNLDVDSKIQAYLDIKKFIKLAGEPAIQEAIDEKGYDQLGIDFWLSRNGHGAGFFDHGYDSEKELMTASEKMKEVHMYIGDDLKIYFN